MIPLNATEAADLLRIREREAITRRSMIEHFGILQENERGRLARVEAEVATLRAWAPQSEPDLAGSSEGKP